jgi:hypothetical protein
MPPILILEARLEISVNSLRIFAKLKPEVPSLNLLKEFNKVFHA